MIFLLSALFVGFDFLHPSQQFFSYVGMGLPGLTINVSCARTQRSDADEARTRNPSFLSQALYH